MDAASLWNILISCIAMAAVICCFALFYYLSVIIHELGHLFAAVCVGWKPVSACLGHGERRTLFRIGGVAFQIGSHLLGGTAHAYARRLSGFRIAQFLFALGGPLATASVALALYAIAKRFGDGGSGLSSGVWIWMLLANEVWLLVATLWPHMADFSGERLPSDGLNMWRTLRLRNSDVPIHFSAHVIGHSLLLLQENKVGEARMVFESGETQLQFLAKADSYFGTGWICVLLEADRLPEAREACQQLLNPHPGGSRSRINVLDALASIPVFQGHRALLPEAVGFIDQALLEAPEKITLWGTKGSLLIESGEIEDGVRLLEEVMMKTEEETDRAICAWYLALAHHKRGDSKAAQECLRLAKCQYDNCPVARRIEAEIWASPLEKPTGSPMAETI